ncbi:hypothetical protein [Actinopolyspora mzabensis]|uniref:hypothetical protein n=1 Tax=Actinopolyspora mzabensis TaxID=995066 RepID=UPI001FDEC153|nr:hypothetical protein [Actinopolyspora mzabensis]
MLLLLLAAAGVLVFAVAAGSAQWAWLSVLLCAVAAVLLFWSRARDRKRGPAVPRHSAHAVADDTASGPVVESEPEPDESGTTLGGDTTGPPAEAVEPDPDTEPSEQRTDAADVLLVCESGAEVFVIDERPRYHLDDCSWVGQRATLPLPAGEARELGFTPCAVCCPDTAVARLERSSA